MEVLITILYIFLAVLVLLFMITVHELGHYLAGKALGFKIKQFSIGFGPAIFKRKSKKNGQIFAIRVFPLGGFCEFEGEDEAGNSSPEAFNNQKPWKRIIVLFSGAFANFIISILIVILVFSIGGMHFPSVAKNYEQSYVDLDGNKIKQTSELFVKEEERLKEGDIILEVGGKFQYLNTDLGKALSKFDVGENIPVTVIRDGKRIEVLSKKGYFVQPGYDRIESDKDVPLYKDKNILSEQLSMLKHKQQIGIIEKDGDFYYVRIIINEKECRGYVEVKYINYIPMGTIKGDIKDKKTPLYKSENVLSEQLLMLPSGQQVDILEKGDGFWRIETTLNNKEYSGYVRAEDVTDAFIGLGIGQGAEVYRLPFFESLGRGFVYSFKMSWEMLSILGKLVTGQIPFTDVGGPIATIGLTAEVARSGFRNLVDIIALIGINLAIMNILPIPSLDGARMVFVGIEVIRKKPVKREIEAKIHMWGIIILFTFVILADVFYLIFRNTG